MDAFSRLALSIIALLLLVLVLGQLGAWPGPGAGQIPESVLTSAPDAVAAEADEPGDDARFGITPIRIPPKSFFLIRIDRRTGRTWKVSFPATASGWVPIAEEEEVRLRRAAREAERKAEQAADSAETP